MNISATWFCPKCKQSFRDTFDAIKEKGHVACGTPYEKLTHTPIVIFDSREQASQVPAICESLGCEVIIVPNLEVGDMVVSDNMAFERKAIDDFLQDWITNRELFNKLHDLKKAYRKPTLLLEGYTEELFTTRGIDPEKVQACIWTIARMGIPMVETLHPKGTAMALKWFAEKEQSAGHKLIQLHGKRSHLRPHEQLEYFVSAAPEIGRGTAISLLEHFGSIERIAFADIDDLTKVKNIGVPTANKIVEFFTRKYNVKKE